MVQRHRRAGLDDRGGRIDAGDVGSDRVDRVGSGRVDLVDHHDVGHSQVDLAGVIVEFVTGPNASARQIGEFGTEERRVVVAPVPDDHVGLGAGLGENRGVVDAGIDHETATDGFLVLLTFLDRGVGGVDLGERREPLDPHRLQVAVGHRVPHEGDPQPGVGQQAPEIAAGLALADTGA